MTETGALLLSRSEQDYLKAIYAQTRNDQPTSTVALAAALGIRAASVTNMLQKLANSRPDLLIYRKRYGVSLTAQGEKAALEIIRRHRLLEQFLYETLGYPLEKIHADAEALEHAVSDFFIDRLAAFLKHPIFDPHGDPIPGSDLRLDDPRRLAPLTGLRAGQRGVARLFANQNPETLRYLHAIGVCPGAEVRVLQTNPLDGALQVEVAATRQTHVLGEQIAGSIQVELI